MIMGGSHWYNTNAAAYKWLSRYLLCKLHDAFQLSLFTWQSGYWGHLNTRYPVMKIILLFRTSYYDILVLVILKNEWYLLRVWLLLQTGTSIVRIKQNKLNITTSLQLFSFATCQTLFKNTPLIWNLYQYMYIVLIQWMW